MTSISLGNAKRTGRVTRSPRHSFSLRHRPFLLQPFMLAPVLPGETMSNALLQSRAVTSPIANPLAGWWLEYYFFYVKHRDLEPRDDFTAMMLDLDYDLSAHFAAAKPEHYHTAGKINWVGLCMDRIVAEYFRDADEPLTPTIDGLPVVMVNADGITNSLTLDADMVQPADMDVDADGDGTITAAEVDATMRNWQFQRLHNMTDMDYEDWLATYGITPKAEEHHRPELLRYIREWQYPSNTVNPEDGVPSSAVSWAIADRLDKDRFFREPGFIVGLTVARPKVYLRNQAGSVSDVLAGALEWLPAVMRDDPWTSLKQFAEGAGPFPVIGDDGGYWVDIKDLFIHGDQFINFATTGVNNGNFVDLPDAAGNSRYPSTADIDRLFVDAAKDTVAQDGVVQINIKGALTDTTPNLRRG